MAHDGGQTDSVEERARFLAHVDPFTSLPAEHLREVAAALAERLVPAGDAVLVEGGPPGDVLWVVREGTFELIHEGTVVAIVSSGDVFGHPTLLTGLPPEFTTRAREESHVYCLPRTVALEVLSRPEGVQFVARTGRDRLIQAARMVRDLRDVRTRTVASLLREPALFCEPTTTVREAATKMAASRQSAILVRTRKGLGIVTDSDLRAKVVAGEASRDDPVSAIMTLPAQTVRADVLAPEAAIEMMAAGVDHLPVLDRRGRVLGVLSTRSLMRLDALSPFALRRSIQSAHSVDDLVKAARRVPRLFVDLLDANLEAPALTRILTLLCDAMTQRLLQLSIAQRGQPPVAYAWLAFGSTARMELTLISDQDNGLAYADSDDPAVGEYFRLMAEDVNEGLRRCGFRLDRYATVASNWQWRLPLSTWRVVFARALQGTDLDRLARASVAFDFRQVAGDLVVAPTLNEIMREAPQHRRFLGAMARLGTALPLPLGFRGRLLGMVDIKKDCLLPIQNLARYYALARGIAAAPTLERLVAVHEASGEETELNRSLREAFTSMAHLQLRHHANLIRAGRPLNNIIDVSALRPLTRVTLQEALHVVAAAQKRPERLARQG